jgi:hypothetical protein
MQYMTQNLWPALVTLTMSQHGLNIGSVHRLYEVYIWPKVHEILFRGLEVMKWHKTSGYNL